MSYPGTSLYEYAKGNDLLEVKSFKEFDMTREELQTILARAYKEFYFRLGYILQTLRHLTNRDEWNRVLRSLNSLLKTIQLHK